ncbi:MAG TPA: hypothetical protein PLN21_15975 [Gemmatales bacterium]|nr:hypothetical protein [Gemmatales bacterium]
MEDPIRLTAIATQLSNLSQNTAIMSSELGELKKETSVLRVQVRSLQGNLQTAQWIICLILVLLVLVIGAAVYAGKSFAKETIREVVQAETIGHSNVTQHGYLSNRTKKIDNPLTFEWILKQPISPHRIVSIIAEPSAFLPGMTVEAKCVKDGKACQIIVLGSTNKFLELLEDGVQCKVTVTLKAD